MTEPLDPIRPPGAEPAYKFGIAHLYGNLDIPCVPIALNSGLYWPRRKFMRHPGTIKARFLKPIPAGLDKTEFMDRLISLALPRVRDFRGISRKAFDGNGSYSLGLSEQLVFPELNPDKFTRVQGMNITFVIKNSTDDESRELLAQMGMPFQTEEVKSAKKK